MAKPEHPSPPGPPWDVHVASEDLRRLVADPSASALLVGRAEYERQLHAAVDRLLAGLDGERAEA